MTQAGENNIMTHDYHEFEVKKQNYIPNKENPKKIEITVKAEINGEFETETKRFTPAQVSEGRWEKHFCRWIEEEEGSHEIPDLEGETIENSGVDHTGPERDYPER